MDFTFFVDEKMVVLYGMANEGPKEVSTHQMEAIFWHDDIAWTACCFVSTKPVNG